MHVRRGPSKRTRARAELLGQDLSDRRFDQFHRSRARRVGRQGDRLERQVRPAGAERRSARQDSRLDGRVHTLWRPPDDSRGGRRRPRTLRRGIRSRDRRRRQGRDRRSIRTRRREIAVRQAAARARADLCSRHDAATRAFRRLFQPHSDGRGVFRVSGADHLGAMRDHGFRRHSRRSDGLLARRQDAGGASGQIEMDPRYFPAVGSRALPVDRTDRRQRPSDRRRSRRQ